MTEKKWTGKKLSWGRIKKIHFCHAVLLWKNERINIELQEIKGTTPQNPLFDRPVCLLLWCVLFPTPLCHNSPSPWKRGQYLPPLKIHIEAFLHQRKTCQKWVFTGWITTVHSATFVCYCQNLLLSQFCLSKKKRKKSHSIDWLLLHRDAGLSTWQRLPFHVQ